ncbi:hypothetical protein RvY_00693 [Ramazzottius varieornatus]|uniref:Hyccin n=1 Tax=Ramazzottius varieornatus TaxID=947166 RepID=A0A1D1UKW2_RAMVA|nr:hypothetical protein RvY_00693 [Ramazzottius varieornatus]
MESPRAATKLIHDFTKDLEQQRTEGITRQGPTLANDEKLLGSLMEFLLSEQAVDEQTLLERFYTQMLRCYRTFDEYLMKFVCQFIFCFIWRHFSDLLKSRQSGAAIRPGLDALIVAIYNMSIVDREGHPRVQTYTVPSLAVPSIYHDPAEFTAQILKDSTRVRGQEERRVIVGNYPPVEALTRTKKWVVFRILMRSMSQDLAYHSKACQKSFIIMCRLLIPSSTPTIARTDVSFSARKEATPFDRLQNKLQSTFTGMGKEREKEKSRGAIVQTRIVLDERFLLDSLDILFILAYQGLFEESLGLVLDLVEEGEYRLLASVVLVGSAIRNRLETSKKEPDEVDEIPPIVIVSTSVEEPSKKSWPSANGSVRERRKKSTVKREGSATSKHESFHEISEVDGATSAMKELVNDSIIEHYTERVSPPIRSIESSPVHSVNLSPRSMNGVAETNV